MSTLLTKTSLYDYSRNELKELFPVSYKITKNSTKSGRCYFELEVTIVPNSFKVVSSIDENTYNYYKALRGVPATQDVFRVNSRALFVKGIAKNKANEPIPYKRVDVVIAITEEEKIVKESIFLKKKEPALLDLLMKKNELQAIVWLENDIDGIIDIEEELY